MALLRVAVVGSREGVDAQRVTDFVLAMVRKHPGVTVVSGGAKGVDQAAESAALSVGSPVISFRPVVLDGGWGVERWQFGFGLSKETKYDVLGAPHPTWVDFKGAAFYRNLLISEASDRLVAFWDGRSRGTASSIDGAHAQGIPIHVYTP